MRPSLKVSRRGLVTVWVDDAARLDPDLILFVNPATFQKGGFLFESEILRNTFKVYVPVQLKTNYVFPCRFKQWFNHYLIDTIENVYLNFCTLIFRDNILFDFQVLFLHCSECECLIEQNIFWLVGQPDFGFPPIKECKNVKSIIIILWDVPLEFRNWYPFYPNRSVDNITLPK